ncbi:MAG: hypothetical protein QOH83_359 [Solirubrobacteraceae bacterium]|nr:hypothetical protein [Solirubrobacteraceae bacterium]
MLMAVALTSLLTATCAPANASNPAGTLGVYAGSGKPDAVAAFESRLGRTVNQVHDYQPRDTWNGLTAIGWALGRWTASRYAHRVVYSIPMLPDSGGTLAEGAAGAYNDRFRILALALVAGGDGAATLRLGWEFNGNWYRWSIGVANGPAHYAAYWRQIVTTMRSVPGANFKFDWCPNNGGSTVNGKQLSAAGAYPGDAYVDYVGMDIYDQSWSAQHADPSARWKEYVTKQDGLGWQRDFAAAHGKQLTFPEWGLARRQDGNGGGDSPYFIERMYEWIRTNPVAYHNYFEFSDSALDAALFDGKSPNASKRFVELFGPSSTGAALNAAAPAAGPVASTGAVPTQLSITTARIVDRSQRLELLASISRLATGSVQVEVLAGGRHTRFAAKIDSKRGRLRISRRIPGRRAGRRGAIATISYAGNARTLPKTVRLRAGAHAARLTAKRPSIQADRLVTSGSVVKAARGVVRLQLAYNVDARDVTRTFSAAIHNGRWALQAALSPSIRAEIARRAGSVSAHILYAGYRPASIGGALRFAKVLGAL